jgi:hypothetical protein
MSLRLAASTCVDGIGERTAVAILVRMPEIGRLSREEAAALVGLAPYDDDSGEHRGQHHIEGDRVSGCAPASTLPLCRPRSAGTPSSSPSTNA